MISVKLDNNKYNYIWQEATSAEFAMMKSDFFREFPLSL